MLRLLVASGMLSLVIYSTTLYNVTPVSPPSFMLYVGYAFAFVFLWLGVLTVLAICFMVRMLYHMLT